MNEVEYAGFRIHYFRDLSNAGTRDLRTVCFDASVPLIEEKNCVACEGGEMKTLYTLVSGGGRKKIRRGLCETCGYIGYIDKPTRSWISTFYREEWDNAKLKDIATEASFESAFSLPGNQRVAVDGACRLPLDKSRVMCDIGCGKGGVLRAFAERGFTKLIGVESSRYRGELVRKKYGLPIFIGDFNDVAAELGKERPMGLLFSFHVLEHVFDPRAFLATAASLQLSGDYLVIATPNGPDEKWLNRMFWLPHLHSFTKTSLCRLFAAYGYEVVDTEETSQIVVYGRKVAAPRIVSSQETFSRESEVKKFVEGMHTNGLLEGRRYRLEWRTKQWAADYVGASSYDFIDRFQQRGEWIYDFVASRAFGKFANRRSCVISPIKERYTLREESPIEIQYSGDIELLVR